MSEKLPRGVRNHNPGNIRLSKTRWQGQKEFQFDPAFVEFEDPVMGLRALMKVLLTYDRKYGLDTVQSIINRWAPPHENATGHYAAHVCKRLNVKMRTTLNMKDPQILIGLAEAITLHENGWPRKPLPKAWYPREIYEQACRMAMNLKKEN